MLITFLQNISLIISFIFILIEFKKHVFKKNIKPLIYKIVVIVGTSLLSVFVMIEPFFYHQLRFDFRSLPIFAVSYIGGWKAGMLAAILPSLYRLYIGGPIVWASIFIEIVLAVIIGAIFNDSDIIYSMKKINIKRVIISFMIFAAIKYLIPIIWFSISLFMGIKLFLFYIIFSITTFVIAVKIINKTNKTILEYQNVKEDLLESKKELEHNRLITQSISNLSHELKTPLNLILSALQLTDKCTNKDCSKHKSLERYIKIVKQNSFRLLRLVNNIIDTTKMEADLFTLHLENNDIVSVVRSIIDSVKDYVEASNKSLLFNTQVSSKITAIDPDSFERILFNLLSNAIKYTDDGGVISVNIFDKKDGLVISVKDTGIGIENNKQEEIFELFKQAEDPAATSRKGSGIGLYLVKLLVEMHGGDIKVKSKKGEGSEFIIELPVRVIEEDEEVQVHNINDVVDRVHLEFSDI